MNGLHAERIWVTVRHLVGSIRGRLRESVDQFVANRFTADCCFVPAETFVEIPLLELLADVVDGDEMRPLYSRNAHRDELGTDLFVGELDECALDKRDDSSRTSAVRERQFEIRPRFFARLFSVLAIES